MKLRNKKTGEIVDLCDGSINSNIDGENIIVFSPMHPGKHQEFEYTSLSELNEEWEDYEPAALIKDEKIRKLLSDWAKLTQTTKIFVAKRRTLEGENFAEFFSQEKSISLEFLGRFDGLIGMKDYTIAELCGEEQE